MTLTFKVRKEEKMKKKIGKIISGILVASVCCVTSIAFGVAALNETHMTAKAESAHAAVNVFEPTTKTDEAPQNVCIYGDERYPLLSRLGRLVWGNLA